MTDDHVDIFPSEEDAGCIADIPGLAHGSAFGVIASGLYKWHGHT